ncbi:unnamed protein product, partial [Darwinula stevensoni]
CRGPDVYECGSGECISVLLRCNQAKDCEDGSDERDCTCAELLQAKFLLRKICDGVSDCWDFSDEKNCEWCTPGQYHCLESQSCVDRDRVCDGIHDCPYGDDESHCVTVSPTESEADDHLYHRHGFLMIRKGGNWGKLCLENFNEIVREADTHWAITDIGRAACRALTYT